MDSAILWRVAAVQVVAVAVLSLLLGLVFSHGFFESAGWLVGPLAWMACAWLTARIVGLPEIPGLIRASLAGIPSLLFVLLGLHWLGAAVAVAIFAAWCAYLPRPATDSASGAPGGGQILEMEQPAERAINCANPGAPQVHNRERLSIVLIHPSFWDVSEQGEQGQEALRGQRWRLSTSANNSKRPIRFWI